MKNTRDDKMQRLGRAGETIVSNYFSRKGCLVEASVDQFDSKKDMLVDGNKVEVKTQVPFVYKNSFTIKENQLPKCINSDYVVFVSVPAQNKEHFSFGKVYGILPKDMVYERHTTKDNRHMIVIPINQQGMKELFTMDEEESKLLQSYSVSSWN